MDFYRINEDYNKYQKANKIYEMVTSNRKRQLTDNSCAFSMQ